MLNCITLTHKREGGKEERWEGRFGERVGGKKGGKSGRKVRGMCVCVCVREGERESLSSTCVLSKNISNIAG